MRSPGREGGRAGYPFGRRGSATPLVGAEKEEVMTTRNTRSEGDQAARDKVRFGFYAVLAGLATLTAMFIAVVVMFETATDVSTALGAVAGTVGTLVGAFFGIQVGTAGKEKAEDDAKKLAAIASPELAARALGFDISGAR